MYLHICAFAHKLKRPPLFDFESTLPHWINRLSFQIRAQAQQALTDAGIDLTPEEWAVLMVLWSRGPQRMTELAATTFRDRTTVTRMIDRLARKGLIQRQSNTSDRRSVRVAATAAGHALEPQVMAVMLPFIAQATAGLESDEIERALTVMRRISANLDADIPAAASPGAASEK